MFRLETDTNPEDAAGAMVAEVPDLEVHPDYIPTIEAMALLQVRAGKTNDRTAKMEDIALPWRVRAVAGLGAAAAAPAANPVALTVRHPGDTRPFRDRIPAVCCECAGSNRAQEHRAVDRYPAPKRSPFARHSVF